MLKRTCTADQPHDLAQDQRGGVMDACTREQANAAVKQTRMMFARTLACWAHELLLAQHRGLHLATWTEPRAVRRAA